MRPQSDEDDELDTLLDLADLIGEKIARGEFPQKDSDGQYILP